MKKTSKCFCCCELKPMTEEHIIPQSLGGKLSAYIYCKNCNEIFWKGIEGSLNNNFGYFTTALKIKRQRGTNQLHDVLLEDDGIMLTFNGEEFRRKNPIVKIVKQGDKIIFFDIRARSHSELDNILNGIKNKYQLDNEPETEIETHPGPNIFQRELIFDNSFLRRAISKIAYNLLCIRIPDQYIFSSSFENIRNYIRFGAEKDLASANFRYTSFMSDYVRPLHRIHISFNRQKGLVIGFICLFGIFKYTTLLSNNFNIIIDLADIDYTFDPTTGKEICTPLNFMVPVIEVNDVISPKQSKPFVLNELMKGHKILQNYIEGYKLLNIEGEG